MIWTNSNVFSVAKLAFFEVTPIHIPNQQIAIRFAASVTPEAAALTIGNTTAATDEGVPPKGCRTVCVEVFVPVMVVMVTTPFETRVVVTTFVPLMLLVVAEVLTVRVAALPMRPQEVVERAAPARFKQTRISTGQPYIRSNARQWPRTIWPSF